MIIKNEIRDQNILRVSVLSILLLCIAISVIGQPDRPEIMIYRPYYLRGLNSTEIDTTIYWNSGKVRVVFENVHDTIYLHKEFFEDGRLKLTMEFYLLWCTDTAYTENLKTGELEVNISSSFCASHQGKYNEYQSRENVTSGQFDYGRFVGEWYMERGQNDEIVAQFSDEGWLEGPYFIYYESYLSKTKRIKWKGQYATHEYDWVFDSMGLDTSTVRHVKSSERVGVWEYYDLGGNLLQTITYDWVKD